MPDKPQIQGAQRTPRRINETKQQPQTPTYITVHHIKTINLGFPGGAVVKNLPANAGDTSSSPYLGGSHMLWSK